ncbi:hypothetical protein L9F63_018860 [Diploptera punctata]|uniref:Uncharacterized protein n=1 Tax=Diploptera punctata TaxID=6984 RepID=A0AAD7ZVT7_DIPPU|nr:hypothetical protein L9F63_018860 [Diploptera punctata]
MGMRHASCIGQRISTIETGVPSNVQILDVSNNTISLLERRIFKVLGMTSLYKLQLQFNRISVIDLHAFEGVTQLRILDLSFNHLYYILSATFEDTPHLRHLYLQGNRIKFYDGPILNIPTLQILDISGCQIDHIKSNSFLELPSLQSLNLSNNQMIRLDTEVIEPLKYLKKIGLERNPWSCDGNAYALEARLNNLNIEHNPICEKRKHGIENKLQKMISIVNNTNYDNDAEIISDDDLIKIWFANDEGKLANMKNNNWMCKNDTGISKNDGILSAFDKIPSFWSLLIGFEVGCVFGGLFMWMLLRMQQTRVNTISRPYTPIFALQSLPNRTSLMRLRSTGEESTGLCSETDVPDCPGTPPPPYRDVFSTFSRRN